MKQQDQKRWPLFFIVVCLLVFGAGIYFWNQRAPTPVQQARLVLREAQQGCNKESDRTTFIRCVKLRIQTRVHALSPKAFMEALDELGVFEFDGINRCHDVAHAVGQLGAREQADISFCSASLCGDGCYHGAMEGLVSSGQQLLEVVSTACKSIPQDVPRSSIACFHGMGHGIGTITGNIEKSFALCDGILDYEDRKNCGAGALMELYQSPSVEHAKVAIPEGNVRLLCSSFPLLYQPLCYVQAAVFDYEQHHDITDAFTVCQKIPADYQKACISKLGAYLLNTLIGSSEKVLTACTLGGQSEFSSCLYGAVEESVFSDKQARMAQELCNGAEDQEACWRFFGMKVQEAYGQKTRQLLCSSVVDVGRPWCLGE